MLAALIVLLDIMRLEFFWKEFAGEIICFCKGVPSTENFLLEEMLTETMPIRPFSARREADWRRGLIWEIDEILHGESSEHIWQQERGCGAIDEISVTLSCNFGNGELVLDILEFREVLVEFVEFLECGQSLKKTRITSINI